MLSTMRSSWLLLALLALVALSTAFSVEDALNNIDGINAYLHHGIKRQAEGTGASSSAPAPTTSDEPEPSTSADKSSSAPQPSTTPPPASTSAEPTPDDPSTSAPAPSTQSDRSSAAPPPSSTEPPAPSRTSERVTTPIVTKKPLVSTEVALTTTVITIVSNGQILEQTSVGSVTREHTTGTTLETSLPTGVVDKDNDGGSGLSSEKKAIIGGVIGGVGGAILLGGIAIVCWRMWGKKKRVSEDDADLMAGTGAALGDKSHNSTSPFQSNLEQYHNPGGRPNAAANF